ncbi:MAG: DNA-protecting protein DprA, partial [Casimicrobiaceae bacterium]
IRDGAKLVETAQDVLDELRLPNVGTAVGAKPPAASDDDFTDDERAVFEALGHAPVAIDALAQRSGRPPEVVAAALLALELAGRAAPVPGGLWQRLS